MWRLNIRTYAGLMFIAIVLPILAGCLLGTRTKPTVKEPVPVSGPGAMRLEEGREGFMIREVPDMDESSRKDFELAVTMMNEKNYAPAIELLEKVIERSPGVTAPYVNLAIAYGNMQKPEQAEAHLKTALRLFPDHPAASNEYALLCRKAGRFDEAREVYQKVITRFPDYYPVRRNLGILCDLYLKDGECALEQYEIYSAAWPEDRQVKLWIADLKNRIGR